MLPADSRSNPNNIFIIFSNTSTKPSLPFVMPISYHDTTTPLQTFHPFLSVVMTCSSHFGVPSGDQLYLVIPNHPRNPDGLAYPLPLSNHHPSLFEPNKSFTVVLPLPPSHRPFCRSPYRSATPGTSYLRALLSTTASCAPLILTERTLSAISCGSRLCKELDVGAMK